MHITLSFRLELSKEDKQKVLPIKEICHTAIIKAGQYLKDKTGVYVIGRRALGFKEEIPENYLKLLSDREYLEYAIYSYEEKEKELREKLKEETNQYKKNAINSELKGFNLQ